MTARSDSYGTDLDALEKRVRHFMHIGAASRADLAELLAAVHGLQERPDGPSSEETDRLRKENTILRGLVQHNADWKCTYGYLGADKQPLKSMGHCPLGFPGCSCADDLLCAEEETLSHATRSEKTEVK